MTISSYATRLRRHSTAGAITFALAYVLAMGVVVWSFAPAEAAVLPDWLNEPALTPRQGAMLLAAILAGISFLVMVNWGFEAADEGEE